jgi:conserved oligomeric Golgi complex subunit 6
MHQLLEIIDAYEATYEGGQDDVGDDFEAVLAATVDPLVEMCERSAEALSVDAPSRRARAGNRQTTASHHGKPI